MHPQRCKETGRADTGNVFEDTQEVVTAHVSRSSQGFQVKRGARIPPHDLNDVPDRPAMALQSIRSKGMGLYFHGHHLPLRVAFLTAGADVRRITPAVSVSAFFDGGAADDALQFGFAGGPVRLPPHPPKTPNPPSVSAFFDGGAADDALQFGFAGGPVRLRPHRPKSRSPRSEWSMVFEVVRVNPRKSPSCTARIKAKTITVKCHRQSEANLDGLAGTLARALWLVLYCGTTVMSTVILSLDSILEETPRNAVRAHGGSGLGPWRVLRHTNGVVALVLSRGDLPSCQTEITLDLYPVLEDTFSNSIGVSIRRSGVMDSEKRIGTIVLVAARLTAKCTAGLGFIGA